MIFNIILLIMIMPGLISAIENKSLFMIAFFSFAIGINFTIICLYLSGKI